MNCILSMLSEVEIKVEDGILKMLMMLIKRVIVQLSNVDCPRLHTLEKAKCSVKKEPYFVKYVTFIDLMIINICTIYHCELISE